ncbi:MAG: helix-turn-helix domain-containing protein [Legionella sp.]|nr:helix-turn-helix domain-containing protein [Legionella sp.]
MNTLTTDDSSQNTQENPGAQLARIRDKRGFTKEYVAGKLHLRVRVIELLEADDYKQMPEPVFIKGYFRAYAKLLGVSPEPFLQTFNNQYSLEQKPEKALWQSKRESNKGELVVRWVTGLVAIAAIIAVSFWWQKNKDAQPFFAAKKKEAATTTTTQVNPEVKLTDLSRMQSMFTAKVEEDSLETQGG